MTTSHILMIAGLLAVFGWRPARGAETLPVSPLQDIHAMHRKEAALAKPVKVRGVVTYTGWKDSTSLTIEDEHAGVYVTLPPRLRAGLSLSPGSLVEITGTTGPGGYAPVIEASAIELLGTAPLPTARPVTVPELLTGRFDSRRIEVTGVVQHAKTRDIEREFAIEVAGEFGRIKAFAVRSDGVMPTDLIDAEVLIRGVCFLFFNERSQVYGARIELNSAREIEITRAPPADPFAAPLVELDELQAYSPEGPSFHRQRVRGTVTLSSPDGYLFLQQDTHAVRVNLAEAAGFQPGDQVEATGFPQARTRFVEWQQALTRKLGEQPVPQAVPTTPGQVLSPLWPGDDRMKGDFDGRLISLTGTLQQIEMLDNGDRQLFIDCDGHVITALRNQATSERPPDTPRTGSRIKLTGVCVVDYNEGWPALTEAEPVNMRLLLRGPEDITVIQPASWWTPARLRIALAVFALLVLAALPWIRSLRRKIEQRTAELASETRARRDDEVEFQATLRERERVAADMHDTVEQALTGVSYQLALADRLHDSEPGRGREHLKLASQLLAQSREDVRRSVWNLRAQALDGRPLTEVLRDVAAGFAARHSVNTTVSVTGPEREIPEHPAGHLLLLAQEAMTNAAKHAAPEDIDLTLAFGPDHLDLRIRDDGSGFDPPQAPGLAEGHLGLQGMRERMKRLGGSLQIDSQPGHGTEIRATVPLA